MSAFNRSGFRESKPKGKSFDTRNASGGFRPFGARGAPRRGKFFKKDRKLDLFTVTCDKCGEETQVPFKPTSGKPVYCSDCFKKGSSEDSKKSFEEYERKGHSGQVEEPEKKGKDYSRQLDEINEKLDRILEYLELEDDD